MQINIPDEVIKKSLIQEYFNVGESALFLGISRSKFSEIAKKYDLKPYVIDEKVFYKKSNLNAFMEKHKAGK
nr:helix-turn-helix domain-containing protein [Lactobacillus iners]